MRRKRPRARARGLGVAPAPERLARRLSGEDASAARWAHVGALVAIALVSCLLYANTIPNALVYDDLELIPQNPLIHNPWALRAIFGGSYWGEVRNTDLYRPLTVWSLALNYRGNVVLGKPGEHASSFHLVNLLVHAGVGCLLYRFLLRVQLQSWPSLATALLFVAHPIHTEAVAGVVGRAELLAALFGLVFLSLHRRRQATVAGAFTYLLAMWSKESALAFFPLAMAMDVCLRVPAKRWPLGAYAVYALTAVIWSSLRAWAIGGVSRPVPFIDNPLAAASLLQRLLTAARVQFDYLRLQLVPIGLSSDYSYNQIPILSTAADPRVLGFMAIGLAALSLAWLSRGKHPAVAFAVLGYAVLFSVTSNFLVPIGTIMGERLAYAPSIFVCLLLGYATWSLRQATGRLVVALVPAVLLVFYSALTVERNRTWANERAFFETQARAAPRSAKARYNLGTALGKSGDDRSAVKEYEAAIAIFPYYSEAFYNLGNALRRLSAEPARVMEAYRNAIRFDPGHRSARGNLALVLADLGRKDEARRLVEELVQLDPQHPSLAVLRLRLGTDTGTAGALPDDLQQGITLYVNGNPAGAIQYLERALSTGAVPAPMRRATLMMLWRALEATGKADRAAAYRKQAEVLGPIPETARQSEGR